MHSLYDVNFDLICKLYSRSSTRLAWAWHWWRRVYAACPTSDIQKIWNPLRAWLLDREDDKDFLQQTQENYSAFRIAEFAFVIMHEWRNRKCPKSLQQLHDLMLNAEIDGHIFCMVRFSFSCRSIVAEAFQSYCKDGVHALNAWKNEFLRIIDIRVRKLYLASTFV